MHVLFTLHVDRILKAAGIPFAWTIVDMHDQSVVECSIEHAEQVKKLLNEDCYTALNRQLKGEIPLRGDAQIVPDLSYAKVSKEDIRQYLKDIGVLDEDEYDSTV